MGFEEGNVGRGNTLGVGFGEVAVVHVDTVGHCEMFDLNPTNWRWRVEIRQR